MRKFLQLFIAVSIFGGLSTEAFAAKPSCQVTCDAQVNAILTQCGAFARQKRYQEQAACGKRAGNKIQECKSTCPSYHG